jgi:hypothetical protein
MFTNRRDRETYSLNYYSEEELAELFGIDDDEDHPSLTVEERNPSLAKQ